MSLSGKVLTFKKDHIISSFKNKYPEVYEWFNSEYFMKLFTEKNKLAVLAEYRSNFKQKVTYGLPFTDSKGSVELDEIVNYLVAEGFCSYVEEAFREKHLIISLKGE